MSAQPSAWPGSGGVGPHGPGDDADPGRCHAKSKTTQERCRQRAMKGQRVCYAHGGRSGQARAAAQRRLAAEKVEAEVKNAIAFESRLGVTDPFEALSLLADEALAMKEALASRVNSLKQVRYTAHGAGTEQLRAEVALYERAMDRAAKFLDMLVRSGFEERRVKVSEQQGLLVVSVIRGVLVELGLDVTPGGEVATVVARHLRALSPTVKGEVIQA